jgi:hypothetical protein
VHRTWEYSPSTWASTGWFYRPALGSGLTAVKPSLVGMLLLFGNRVRPERARKRRLTELAAWHPYPDEPARALTAASQQSDKLDEQHAVTHCCRKLDMLCGVLLQPSSSEHGRD